ncbi:uncharacterized protein LOC133420874 isoform X1 [Cololabis saira]|uniref:uncharacterized protein LOC133420874 isoform X1 n=1 Tax=Cololabis saira TaxID=129043 RepID=UPI002AD42E36|nr:uncharacterized protein LOC133420874 isoform X1 [Cololabis saira]
MEKMICRILLLIILTSHVCASTIVKVTQNFYQTEENYNITLEWTFTPKHEPSSGFLDIYCHFRKHLKILVVFKMSDGVKNLKHQDEQFAGRVQSDRDALREGRLRLLISRLTTEDSGWYWCEAFTKSGWDSASCQLHVSATRSYDGAGNGGFITLGVVAAAALLIYCVTVLVKKRRRICAVVSQRINHQGVVCRFLMNHNSIT